VLLALIERVIDGSGTLSLRERVAQRRGLRWHWYARIEVLACTRYRDAAGADAEQRTAIQVMAVPPSSRRRHQRKALAAGLAALDEALARNALESGTLLIIHRRPQPAHAYPDPRLSQTRTPGGHDITVLTC
jgi:hypothetical protein